MKKYLNKITQGDCLEVMKDMPSESVDCIITSPPYWALRDYGIKEQLGLEKTFQEYINKLCDIFDEVKRVLKKRGTCWVVLGDTYNAGGNYRGKELGDGSKEVYRRKDFAGCQNDKKAQGIKEKCLCQIPSRFAIEMTNRGWILRNEIIWHKPNCMPSSAKDRFTVDFEKIFFFVKNKKYWFETQYEKYAPASDVRYRQALRANRSYNTKEPYKQNTPYSGKYKRGQGSVSSRGDDADGLVVGGKAEGRNKRTVWKIPTKPYKEAHFAVYPEKLIETPIKAGCPEKGIVLDPFCGSGTTGVVAKKLNRQFIGIELNPEYCKMAEERIKGITKPLL